MFYDTNSSATNYFPIMCVIALVFLIVPYHFQTIYLIYHSLFYLIKSGTCYLLVQALNRYRISYHLKLLYTNHANLQSLDFYLFHKLIFHYTRPCMTKDLKYLIILCDSQFLRADFYF